MTKKNGKFLSHSALGSESILDIRTYGCWIGFMLRRRC